METTIVPSIRVRGWKRSLFRPVLSKMETIIVPSKRSLKMEMSTVPTEEGSNI